MRKLLISIFLTMIAIVIFSQNIKNTKTDDLNMIHYSSAHSYIVPHLRRSYHRTWDFYKDFWDYQPAQPTTVFLEDFSDWANGGATAVTENLVYISMSPYFYVFEVAPANERMSLLMHHELTHVVAMDMASSRDRFFRKLFFGKIQQEAKNPLSLFYAYLATPRKFAPRWYHEGIAVSMETWMSGGIGRAMGSYDEMVFRSMIKDNAKIYHMVGLEAEGTAIDFQVGANSYLYGTRFFSYLGYKYGPKKLIEWVKRNDKSKTYFSYQFENVFQRNLSETWAEWIEFERIFQEQNLAKINRYPITNFNPITKQPMGSVSRSFYQNGKLYSGVKYPGEIPHIAEIDIKTGEKRKICDIKGASTYFTTSMVLDENNIYYTTDNFYRRDLNKVDITSGKSERLIKDLRAGSLAFNQKDKAIWAVRHENGISTLIKLLPPYKDYKAIYAFPYGNDIYDLDISPDGSKMTAAITQVDGNQQLVWYDLAILESGKVEPQQVYDFDYSSPANFVFDQTGRYIFGTSYYNGVSNVYRYDFELDDISIISNCETGFFRPVPISLDSLIVFNYVGGKGWQPGWIKNQALQNVAAIDYLGQQVFERYPYVKEWNYGKPKSIDLEKITNYEGNYGIIRNLHLINAYPIVEGYKNYTALGYQFNFGDYLGLNRLDFSLSYIPDDNNLADKEKFHFSGKYRYKSFSFLASYNKADFYDLFGPTKTGRKGYQIGTSYSKTLIDDKPRFLKFSAELNHYGNLDIMPDYQNVSASYDEMQSGQMMWNYSYLRKSQGAVDSEKGYDFKTVLQSSFVNSELYPAISMQADFGVPLLWGHSSIWLRNAVGKNFNNSADSFSNFYFGGFGNNWIDHKDEKRYRTKTSFPGLDINEIGGNNFAKSILEINLPPVRFSKVGVPAIYLRWMRTALFGSIISTELLDSEIRDFNYNLGAQIDFRMINLSLIKSTLSFGLARAWDKNWQNPSDEFMVSLKVF